MFDGKQFSFPAASTMPELKPGAGAKPEALSKAHPPQAIGATASPADSCSSTPHEPRPQHAGPLTGKVIGDYEILERIAQGGMGEVYKARQVSLNRLVALKMILSARGANPTDLERFRIEVEAAASLDHPRLVPIYEVGEYQGLPWFSMKLIHGGSLAHHMERFQKDHRAAARFIISAARGIHYAHQRGILHRDLKPANILLDEDGRPHVTDFGVAKRLGTPSFHELHIVDSDEGPIDLTQAGEIVGTPSYMAPEQASGKKGVVTVAADIWSIGAILYEMLTGRPPFLGPTRLATVKQVLTERPVPPRAANPRLDMDLAAICMKCLEHNPTCRYATADDLADDLERWLAGQPVLARPLSLREKVLRWARQSPTRAAFAAFTLFLAVGAMGAVAWQWKRAEQALSRVEAANRSQSALRAAAEQALLDQQANNYLQWIALADRLCRGGRFQEARAALEQTDQARRGWEYGFLLRESSFTGQTVQTEAYPVVDLALRPGKTQAAALDGAGRLRLVDLVNGRTLRAFGSPAQRFTRAAWLRGGDWLAAVDDMGCILAWSVECGTWRCCWLVSAGPVRELHASPAGDILAVAVRNERKDGDEVRLYRLADVAQPVVISVAGTEVRAMGFNESATLVALACGDGSVCVHDTACGAKRFSLPRAPSPAVAVAMDAYGARVAVVCEAGKVALWDVGSQQGRVLIEAHTCPVRRVRFHPHTLFVEVLLADGRTHRFGVSGTEERTVSLFARLDSVTALDACGGIVAVGTGAGRITWSRDTEATLSPVPRLHGPRPAVAGTTLPRVGRVLAAFSDGTLAAWDTASAAEVFHLPSGGNAILAMAASKDEQVFAVAQADGVIRLHACETGAELGKFRAPRATAVALNQDGSRLALADASGELCIMCCRDGSRVSAFPAASPSVTALAFGPNQTLAVGSSNGNIYLLNPETGFLRSSLYGQTEPILALAFDERGMRVFSASANGVVRLWDTATGREVLTLALGGQPLIGLAMAQEKLIGLTPQLAQPEWDGSR